MIATCTLQRNQPHPEVWFWRGSERGLAQETSDLSVKSSAICRKTEGETSVKVHTAEVFRDILMENNCSLEKKGSLSSQISGKAVANSS